MRYFIVFYHGQYSSNDANPSVFIWQDHPVESEDFPNKLEAIRQIKENFGLKWVHITGIKEVSKEEFLKYYR